jgi:hypothetical protein
MGRGVEPSPDLRSWPRLCDPPDDVMKVISETGTLWTRMGIGGHYWSAVGYPFGVDWGQVLRWGPVTEVKEES